MKQKNWKLALLGFSALGLMLTGSCQDSPSNQADSLPAPVAQEKSQLVDKQVAVAGEGGSAQVQFVAKAGDQIRIGLTALSPNRHLHNTTKS